MFRLGSLRRHVTDELARAGIARPLLEADLLLSWVLGVDRATLFAHPERPVDQTERTDLDEALKRRIGHEPLAYILGRAAFLGFDLTVGPGCLIPRPETELLVERSLALWSDGPFLDWGTGSGAIAIALLQARPDAEGFAVEAEPSALRWAWRNLKEKDLLNRCLLIHEERLEALPLKVGSLGMIVSNPPYIPQDALSGLMEDVVRYEPHRALDGGSDGLDSYRRLLPWAEEHLRPGGFLVVEHGGAFQSGQLTAMAGVALQLVDCRRDLAGQDRVLAWKRL